MIPRGGVLIYRAVRNRPVSSVKIWMSDLDGLLIDFDGGGAEDLLFDSILGDGEQGLESTKNVSSRSIKLQLKRKMLRIKQQEKLKEIVAKCPWPGEQIHIEAGKALLRLDDLYERSLRVQDTKTALAAERERVKLLGLYEKNRVEEQETIENAEWEPVQRYLGPLQLAPPDAPMEELLRLASLKIIESKSLKLLTYAPEQRRSAPREDAATESGEVGTGSGNLAVAAD